MAAEPVLASTIWLAEEEKDTHWPPHKKLKLESSCKSLDKSLQGGLEYGQIHSLTAATDQDATDILQAWLGTQIRTGSATVIDSTNMLDVRQLFRILETALGNKAAAMKALDRLKIMRVFDYVGLVEAMAELRGELEKEKGVKSTISDSEDEGEDEMLDDSPAAAAEEVGGGGSLLVISSLSHLLAPTLKANYTQAQALLATFMRSLRHLTRTHGLCTVVVGGAHHRGAVSDGEALSQFSSCNMRPALGLGIGGLVDTMLYLHYLPMKGSRDRARILEIVQDRYGQRAGHWGAFTSNPANGQIVDIS